MMKRQLGLLWFALALLLPAITNAGTTTTNYDLYKPVEGDVGWADLINGNADTIDAEIKKAKTSVNTTELDSPDLTDSASLTWGVSGSTVTGTVIEADTLDSVAERGATTDVNLTIDSGGMTNSMLSLDASHDFDLISTPTDTFKLRDATHSLDRFISSDTAFTINPDGANNDTEIETDTGTAFYSDAGKEQIFLGTPKVDFTDTGSGTGTRSNGNILNDPCTDQLGSYTTQKNGTVDNPTQGTGVYEYRMPTATSSIDFAYSTRLTTYANGDVACTLDATINSVDSVTSGWAGIVLQFPVEANKRVFFCWGADKIIDAGANSIYGTGLTVGEETEIGFFYDASEGDTDVFMNEVEVVSNNAVFSSAGDATGKLYVGISVNGSYALSVDVNNILVGDGLAAASFVDRTGFVLGTTTDTGDVIIRATSGDANETAGAVRSSIDTFQVDAGKTQFLNDVFVETGEFTVDEDEFSIDTSAGKVGIGQEASATNTLEVDGEASYNATSDMGSDDEDFASKKYVDDQVTGGIGLPGFRIPNGTYRADEFSTVTEKDVTYKQIDDQYVSFGFITDIHYATTGGGSDPGDVAGFVADVNAGSFDFVLQCGDILDDAWDEDDLTEITNELKACEPPVYNVVGGWDTYSDYATNKGLYNAFMGRDDTRFTFTYKDIQFIIDDTVFNADGDDADSGYPSAEGLIWLEDVLDNTSQEYVMYFSHHPMGDPTKGADVQDLLEAFETAGGTVIGSMNGHSHSDTSTTINGITYYQIRDFQSDNDTYALCYIDLSDHSLYIDGNSLQTDYGTAFDLESDLFGGLIHANLTDGNVGIGTASPTSTLDIVGDIGVADNGNACVITVDTDGTCDAGTAIVVDNSIAICAVCS